MRSRRFALPVATMAIAVSACGSDSTTDEAATADTVTAPVTAPATSVTTLAAAETSVATEPDTVAEPVDEQRFPDVIDATATMSNGRWTFRVTISSPYDTPERYADGWRILGPDGTEYGFRLLTHDHASEQPFTRQLADVEIPADVSTVTIEGRDQQYGFGGKTFELTLPPA